MKKKHLIIPKTPYDSYESYLEESGPSALLKAKKIKPKIILREIMRSGLRGRGGAGFSTGIKWKTLHKHSCPTKYVVCNAAEGEPGTFKDRYLIRKNPFAPLEGMLIAAHLLNAKEIYIGIKASFEREIDRLNHALQELKERGFLNHIEIKIVQGPEEYLFGEEKALLNFIEEGSPLPREADSPPYERGLFSTATFDNPALVNNLETFARIPGIIQHGGESFRTLGTEDTPGTVLFTLSGDIKNPGVYELEAGVTLRTLLNQVGGGGLNGEIKAVLSGVSNGVILPDKFDTPCDFGHLSLIGSGLGSAGFLVYDETRSIPRLAQAMARFLYVESCNQCTACKFGLQMASSGLDTLLDKKSKKGDINRILYGARSAPQGNRCYLPVEGSILIPSLLERFPDEFKEALDKKTSQTKPLLVPLIKDFDEKKRLFIYDKTFSRKNPDWTYEEEIPLKISVKPAKVANGNFGIHLKPDILNGLKRHLIKKGLVPEGLVMDELVNDLLKEALQWRKNQRN